MDGSYPTTAPELSLPLAEPSASSLPLLSEVDLSLGERSGGRGKRIREGERARREWVWPIYSEMVWYTLHI